MPDIILREITSMLLPFIQMYGVYIVMHGHISPGGGFAGGMIIGVSLIVYILVFGLDSCLRKVPHRWSSLLESLGTMWYAAVGLVGLLRGTSFLMNKAAGIDLGTPGELFSSGLIVVITIGVGVKVATTMLSLFYTIVEEETDCG